MATTPTQDLPALPQAFFARPAEVFAPCIHALKSFTGEIQTRLFFMFLETMPY
jgi:hypothetical protein